VADLESAFDDATRAKAQAAVFITDNLLFGHRKEIADIALAHHLPRFMPFQRKFRTAA
jgi:putative ABC transport system substrate-binding protein